MVEETRYSCRGIVVGMELPQRFIIRLSEEVSPDNQREFYRVDVFLPLTYRIRPKKPAELSEEEWLLKIQEDAAIEALLEISVPPPVSANISGSGLRTRLPEKLKEDQQLDLTLYIPVDEGLTRSINVEGVVVSVNPMPVGSAEHPRWDTAIHFVKIDERERDEIIRFIYHEQLRHVRTREEFFRLESAEETGNRRLKELKKVIYTLIVIAGVIFLVKYLIGYYQGHEKYGVEKAFDEGIKDYLKRFGR